mgnify:CR=1 FL=1
MTFTDELEHISIDAYGDIPETTDKDLIYSAVVEWSADVYFTKWGIDGISISFDSVEIEILNGETNEDLKIDFSEYELKKDFTIDSDQICVNRLEIDYDSKSIIICN